MASLKESEVKRERAEERLRHQLDFTRAITNSLGEGVCALDREGRVTFMNPAAERMLGWKEKEFLGMNMHETIHFQRADGTLMPQEECPLMGVMSSSTTYRTEDDTFTRKDGTIFPVSYTSSPVLREGQVTGAVVAFRDMRKRKRIEAEMREQAETLETINRVGRLLAAELDTRKVAQAVTDAATELTGAHFGTFFYNVLDEKGDSCMLYTLSGVPREAFEHFTMPRATDLFGPTFRGEGAIRIADVKEDPRYGKNSPCYGMPEGHLSVTSYLAVPVISRSDEVIGGLFFGHPEEDIFTERDEHLVGGLVAQAAVAFDNARLFEAAERTRTRAEESEQRYRHVTDAMPQLVWATDEKGSHFYYNQRWYDFTGLTEEESRGFGFANALHPDDKDRTLKMWERAWRDGEGYQIEYRFYSRPQGVYRWFLARAAPVRDAAGEITQWVGTCTDIEEQKQMEEKLATLSREREQMLEEVSTPLVPVLKDVLVLPIIGSLDTGRMQRATEAALNEVVRTGACVCIIDITGARIIDSQAVANLSNLVSALRLIGARAIVTGISAHAARSLVGLGLDLKGMRTHRTLAEALAELIKSSQRTNHRG